MSAKEVYGDCCLPYHCVWVIDRKCFAAYQVDKAVVGFDCANILGTVCGGKHEFFAVDIACFVVGAVVIVNWFSVVVQFPNTPVIRRSCCHVGVICVRRPIVEKVVHVHLATKKSF